MQQAPTEDKGSKTPGTGLPEDLKAKLEAESGFDMSDVRVHYNSDKPAQLQANSYSQGNQIYLGPGQEKHLPHEAWHVVQQKQGRIKPTQENQPNKPQNLGISAPPPFFGSSKGQEESPKEEGS